MQFEEKLQTIKKKQYPQMNPKITHWMKIGPGEARSMVSQQDNFWDKIGQNVKGEVRRFFFICSKFLLAQN